MPIINRTTPAHPTLTTCTERTIGGVVYDFYTVRYFNVIRQYQVRAGTVHGTCIERGVYDACRREGTGRRSTDAYKQLINGYNYGLMYSPTSNSVMLLYNDLRHGANKTWYGTLRLSHVYINGCVYHEDII